MASIDALRGFDMFWLIGGRQVLLALVGVFVSPTPLWLEVQMDHVPWEGFSPGTSSCPCFCSSSALPCPYSFARRIEAGQSKAALYRKILTRTAILFVLGMVVQGNLLKADLSQLHLYCNTLQTIAAGYLIASVAMSTCASPGKFWSPSGCWPPSGCSWSRFQSLVLAPDLSRKR